MRNVDAAFDERKYGFGTLQDLLRACQREGLFRIERDRQGVIRLFPGNIMQPFTGIDDLEEEEDTHRDVVEAPVAESGQGWGRDETRSDAEAAAPVEQSELPLAESPGDAGADVVDGDVVQEMEVQQVVDGEEAAATEEPKRGRGTRKRAAQPRAAKKSESAPRAKKTAAKSRAPRARKPASED